MLAAMAIFYKVLGVVVILLSIYVGVKNGVGCAAVLWVLGAFFLWLGYKYD